MSTTTSQFIAKVVELKKEILASLNGPGNAIEAAVSKAMVEHLRPFAEAQLLDAKNQRERSAEQRVKAQQFINKINTQLIEKRTEERIGNGTALVVTVLSLIIIASGWPEILMTSVLLTPPTFLLLKAIGQQFYKPIESGLNFCTKQWKKCWNFICCRKQSDNTLAYSLNDTAKELQLENILLIELPENLTESQLDDLRELIKQVVDQFTNQSNQSNQIKIDIKGRNDVNLAQNSSAQANIALQQSVAPFLVPRGDRKALELSPGKPTEPEMQLTKMDRSPTFTPNFSSSGDNTAVNNFNASSPANPGAAPKSIVPITPSPRQASSPNNPLGSSQDTNSKRASISQISDSSSQPGMDNRTMTSPLNSQVAKLGAKRSSTPNTQGLMGDDDTMSNSGNPSTSSTRAKPKQRAKKK